MDPRYLDFGYSGFVPPQQFVPLPTNVQFNHELENYSRDMRQPSSALSNPESTTSSASSGSIVDELLSSNQSSSDGSGRYEPTRDEINEVLKAKKKTYDRRSRKEEELLVQVWAQYHDGLESREARKYWNKIAEELNKQFESKLTLNKLVEKCQRKCAILSISTKMQKTGIEISPVDISESLHISILSTVFWELVILLRLIMLKKQKGKWMITPKPDQTDGEIGNKRNSQK